METQDLELLAHRFIEESNDAIFILDCDNETVTQANPTAVRLTGRPWRDMREASLGSLLESDDGASWSEILSAVRHTGIFHSEEGFSLRRSGDRPLAVNVTVSRVHIAHGVVALVVARDISERKEHERMLREFNSELETRVQRKTEELRHTNRQLADEVCTRRQKENELREVNRQLRDAIVQLDRAQEDAHRRERLHILEQVAGGIAHDINNSLAAVLTYTELLALQLDDGELKGWADNVLNSTHDIQAIVERLRDYCGRRDSDSTEGAIDLERVLRDVIELTRPKWRNESIREGKEISITTAVEGSPEIIGDPSPVRSILTNLIFNSVDAIEHRGTIHVRAAERDGLSVVEVSDDGSGMTERQKQRCFEPFFTTKPSGTGLGLSVCRAMVGAIGGSMEVDSEHGAGTTVRMLLPSPAHRTRVAQATAADQDGGASDADLIGKRVLYIDDNESARLSMTALLSSVGMDVQSARDGVSGLALFERTRFDTVITDMNMPNSNGLDVTAEMKRRDPNLPVLLISGWIIEDTSNKSDTAPDAVLQKPVTWETLRSKLLDVLLRNDATGD